MDAYEDRRAEERARFYAAAARGRPQLVAGSDDPIDLRHRGSAHRVQVRVLGAGRYRVSLDGRAVEVTVERQGRSTSRLTVGDRTFRVLSFRHGTDHLVDVEGASHRFSLDDGGLVRAPAAAVVISVAVAPGDHVEAGSRVAVLEAMKMEVAIGAPFSGRVSEVLVAPNVQVEAGAPLLRLEPAADDPGEPEAGGGGQTADASEGLDLETLETVEGLGPGGSGDDPGGTSPLVVADHADAVVPRRAELRLGRLGAFVAGYDVTAAEAQAVLGAYLRDAGPPESAGDGLAALELDVIECFADLVALTRDRRDDEDVEDAGLRSAREHFDTYLRSLDADQEGLPDRYRVKLVRALAHYGVTGFEPTPQLEEALLRAYRAQQRASGAVPVVLALLERAGRYRAPAGAGPLGAGIAGAGTGRPVGAGDDRLREVLDRLGAATRHRYPVVASLAAGVRYRCFDWPVIAASRDEVEAAMRDHLRYLVAEPDAPDADHHRDALVECPQPLIGLVVDPVAGTTAAGCRSPGHRSAGGGAGPPLLPHPPARGASLAAAAPGRRPPARGHLRPRRSACGGVRGAGRPVAAAGGAHRPRRRRARRDPAPRDGADRPLPAGGRAGPGRPRHRRGGRLVPRRPGQGRAAGRDRTAGIAVCGPPEPAGAVVHQLTFRPSAPAEGSAPPQAGAAGAAGAARASFVEDRVLRGLHPMIARRLNQWRLANFDTERLPAAPEVHLFRCVAHDNPADERLIAMAEVRDLTPMRDPDGHVSALPELEQVLAACCDALRSARARQPGRSDRSAQLNWNRVQLYVWPEVDSPLDELLVLAPRVAPLTEGLGLEQVVIQGRFRESADAPMRDRVVRLGYESGQGLTVRLTEPPTEPMLPLDDYTQKVLAARRRGYTYPYELIPLLARSTGHFTEYDLEGRPPAGSAGSAAAPASSTRQPARTGRPGARRQHGRRGHSHVTTPTAKHPEGITRVAVLGDPTRALGSIAEAECRRLLGAIDLAEALGAPLEWFARPPAPRSPCRAAARTSTGSAGAAPTGRAHPARR